MDPGPCFVLSQKQDLSIEKALLWEQGLAFQESLPTDKQKGIQLENEGNEIKSKVRFQHARAAIIITEPDADFVTVKVRYL